MVVVAVVVAAVVVAVVIAAVVVLVVPEGQHGAAAPLPGVDAGGDRADANGDRGTAADASDND